MRLILSKQYKKHVKIGKILALPCLLFHLSSLAWGAPVPDFAISPADVQFSPNHPVEGQSVIITADVLNKGGETQADIDVRFFEGAVDNSGLQIGKGAVIVGLRSGEKGKVEAKWRARTGPVNIYVVVDPDNAIAEVDETNNQAIRVITGQALDLPKATPAQIEAAIQKGIKWLRTQQGEFIVLCPDGHGNPAFMEFCMICRKPLKGGKVEKLDDERTRGGWNPIIGPGGTALALMALLHAGVPESDGAVVDGIDYLLDKAPIPDWNQWEDSYDFAAAILALTATGDKKKYLTRVSFATKRLLSMQRHRGWGYGGYPDMAHMHYVLLALYAARKWGIDVPEASLKQAAEWISDMQRKDGGWSYAGIEVTSPWAETSYGSMTATALMGLKIGGVPQTALQFQKGLEWLNRHYTITSNPGAYEWHYYYLLSMQRALTIPPEQSLIGEHNWYDEGAAYFLSQQQPEGSWRGGDQEDPIISTCFAILFLKKAIP